MKKIIKRLRDRCIKKLTSIDKEVVISREDELILNLKKDIRYLLKIVKDLNRIETYDQESKVIVLIDSKGRKASLWLDNKNNLDSITPY